MEDQPVHQVHQLKEEQKGNHKVNQVLGRHAHQEAVAQKEELLNQQAGLAEGTRLVIRHQGRHRVVVARHQVRQAVVEGHQAVVAVHLLEDVHHVN